MSESVRASVFPVGHPRLTFKDVHEVTFVDNESHGSGPVGSIESLVDGTRRLIVASPNITAVFLEPEQQQETN